MSMFYLAQVERQLDLAHEQRFKLLPLEIYVKLCRIDATIGMQKKEGHGKKR